MTKKKKQEAEKIPLTEQRAVPPWSVPVFLFLLVLCGTFLFLYWGTGKAKAALPVEYECPPGNVSSSIFVKQNSEYEPAEDAPNQYLFRSAAFQIDLPEGIQASVGNGLFVQLAEQLVIYVTEGSADQLETLILQEVPSAFLPGFDPEKTSLKVLHAENGYLNGYSVSYVYMTVHCEDAGGSLKNLHLIGYVTQDEVTGQQVLISSVTDQASDIVLARMQQMMEREMYLLVRTAAADVPETKEIETAEPYENAQIQTAPTIETMTEEAVHELVSETETDPPETTQEESSEQESGTEETSAGEEEG